MAAYFVFQNRIVDVQKMQAYIPRVLETMAPYAPEILVLDEHSQVLEGNAPFPRTVIIKFASREAALAWYNSPEYQAVRHLRLEATEGFCVLVDGLVSPGS